MRRTNNSANASRNPYMRPDIVAKGLFRSNLKPWSSESYKARVDAIEQEAQKQLARKSTIGQTENF